MEIEELGNFTEIFMLLLILDDLKRQTDEKSFQITKN